MKTPLQDYISHSHSMDLGNNTSSGYYSGFSRMNSKAVPVEAREYFKNLLKFKFMQGGDEAMISEEVLKWAESLETFFGFHIEKKIKFINSPHYQSLNAVESLRRRMNNRETNYVLPLLADQICDLLQDLWDDWTNNKVSSFVSSISEVSVLQLGAKILGFDKETGEIIVCNPSRRSVILNKMCKRDDELRQNITGESVLPIQIQTALETGFFISIVEDHSIQKAPYIPTPYTTPLSGDSAIDIKKRFTEIKDLLDKYGQDH